MKVDFDISGWSPTQSYKKFDVVFFSGHSVTGCNPFESGYYYATADNLPQCCHIRVRAEVFWAETWRSAFGFETVLIVRRRR